MNKLLDFGKKAVFFVSVISGYEERSIRTFRLKLQKKIQEEQIDHFKTSMKHGCNQADNQAELIMNMQLAREESRMKAMQEQALMENEAVIAAAKEKLTTQASIADATDVADAKEKLTIQSSVWM